MATTDAQPRRGARGPVPRDHRERLLDGMAAAVRATGFQRCTVGDVVREAGASRRTFYAHFPDLDACYLALFEARAEENLLAVAAAVAGEGTPEARLAAAVASYLDALERDPRLASSFFRELHLTGARGRRELRAVNARAGETVHQLAVDARRSEPGLGVEPVSALTARIIVAGIVQLALMAQEEGTDLEEVRAAATGLVLSVLLSPRSSSDQATTR